MRVVLILLALLLLTGCQSETVESPPPVVEQSTKETVTGSPPVIEQATEESPATDTPMGEPSYAFTLPGDTEPSSIYLDTNQLQVGEQWKGESTPNGDVNVYHNGQLKARGTFQKVGRFLINDPSGALLAKIKVRDDGSFKVVDSEERLLCKLKPRDYGYKVTGADEETVLIRVRVSEGKTKIKDGQEQELAKFTGANDSTVVAWIATPALPMEVRIAGALLFKGSR